MSTAHKIFNLSLSLAVVILSSSSAALAQSGCIDASPENPSVVLGLLAVAAAGLPVLRARLKNRSRK
jgi:hypothetical protein